MFKHILIATDGAELGTKAVQTGLALAQRYGSKVSVLTSTDPIHTGLSTGGFGTISAKALVEKLEEIYSTEAKAVLDGARKLFEGTDLDVEYLYVRSQRASDAILGVADTSHCDLVVMGSHGRHGIQKLLLGSQAATVLALAHAPVLVVK